MQKYLFSIRGTVDVLNNSAAEDFVPVDAWLDREIWLHLLHIPWSCAI